MMSTWQIAAIIVSLVLSFVIICLFICASSRAVDKHNAEQTQLQTALNPIGGDGQDGATVEQRHEVAIKVASSGYLVCPNCAFENFTSVTHCTICQTKLVRVVAGTDAKLQVKV